MMATSESRDHVMLPRTCKMVKNRETKAMKIWNFLSKNGDGLPEEALKEATSGKVLDNWTLLCDEEDQIVSGVTYVNNDWYLCTIHYLATRKEDQRKGFGSKVMERAIGRMKKDDSCLILAADVTYDNEGSKKIFRKNGFNEVSRFCWKEGEKPADVLHYVKMNPGNQGTNCKV